ncbi:phytoene desaturase [bacterium]|nr:phytoene desaturase [bacterium]
MTQAIIIGSGIGGLAAAIRLARQGISIDVYESSEKAGGKVSQLNFEEFRFDAGPSLLTLPELVHELLDEDLRFPIRKLEVITKYFYPDGTQVSAYNDVQKLASEIEEKLNVSSSKVTSYLQKAAKVYELTSDLFIFGSFHRIKNLMNRKSLKTLLNFRHLQAFNTLHEYNRQELRDGRLVQLFDRYATYNGSNPYQTPATLSVISHLEHNLGAFIPEGGMFQITESLYRQALRLGIKFHFGQSVLKVETTNSKVSGVWLDSGFVSSDIVVSDVDIHRFYSSLLPDKKRLAKITQEERSSSALIFYWGMKGVSPELDIHNIFFSSDYQDEFEHLFRQKDLCNDPTIYIYISSKYNKSDAPEGCENWFVMINAPADTGQNWDELIAQSRQHILGKLERMMGKKLSQNIICEQILSPPDIFKQTGSVNGSLYGNSSNSRYGSFNRHANFRSDIGGLYFVGGSVHPGGGIPLCLSSANIVSGLVKEQLQKQQK